MNPVFTLLEPHTLGFADLMIESLGINREKFNHEMHPKEDYFLVSKKYPIYTLADGVTLEATPLGDYPNPSGAGEVARIFCEEAVKECEKQYTTFVEEDIQNVFEAANRAIQKYNASCGRTKETSNFWDFDLFAATAAIAVIKEQTVYWGSICDSYVAHFGKDRKRAFRSPLCSPDKRTKPYHIVRPKNEREKKKLTRRVFRNGVDENGNLIGYGVITGEEAALRYVNNGSFDIEEGGILFLYTDGFEHYMEIPEFVSLFFKWSKDLKKRVQKCTMEKSQEDAPKYGRERSLIAVHF